MDLSIKGTGAGLRFARQRIPARRQPMSDLPAQPNDAAEDAAVFTPDLGEAEQMRAAVAAVNQAIEASEMALAWTRLATDGLHEALAHAAMMEKTGRELLESSAGVPADEAWRQLQERWRKHQRAIDAVAEKTHFGPIQLLNGSLGCRAAAFGAGLRLIAVGDDVRSSPPEGYAVTISQEPTRATLLGDVPLTDDVIARRATLEIDASGAQAKIVTEPGESVEQVAKRLSDAVALAGVPVTVSMGPRERVLVQHRRAGSQFAFRANSSVPGILADLNGAPRVVANGRDVAGSLHGEPARGRGQILTGADGNAFTPGLIVQYVPVQGDKAAGWKDGQLHAGRVLVSQQRLRLRWDGAEAVQLALRLDPVRTAELGRGEDSDGRFIALDMATTLPPEVAKSVLAAISRARVELERSLAQVREASTVALPRHLARLRVQAQNLTAASHLITAPQIAMDAVRTLINGLRHKAEETAGMGNIVTPSSMLRLLDEGQTENWPKLN